MQFLLEHGAAVDVVDTLGKSPLDTALRAGRRQGRYGFAGDRGATQERARRRVVVLLRPLRRRPGWRDAPDEKCKVLVVDDHRDGADSTFLLLHLWGHEAVAAYTAEQALKLAEYFDPDVVLVDIGLPPHGRIRGSQADQRTLPRRKDGGSDRFQRASVWFAGRRKRALQDIYPCISRGVEGRRRDAVRESV